MAQLPPWVIGRYVTNMAIYAVTEALDGTLTDGSSAALTSKLQSIELASDPETAEVSAMDATVQNMMLLKENNGIVVSEILQRAGSAPNVLAAWATSNSVGKFVFSRGGKTWSGYYRRGPYHETFDKGAAVGRLTLLTVDPGQTNPSYS